MLKMRREVEEDGTVPSSSGKECCMCGDYGLSSQLFKCKHCRFRFQHKYCSNLYPEAESYNTCNWCLVSRRKDDDNSNSKSSSPSNSSSSNNHRQVNNCSKVTIKKRKRLVLMRQSDDDDDDDDDDSKNNNNDNNGGPNDIKEMSSCVAQRVTKRNVGGGEIAKRMIIKKVFRNKVRRYKLLEEVTS